MQHCQIFNECRWNAFFPLVPLLCTAQTDNDVYFLTSTEKKIPVLERPRTSVETEEPPVWRDTSKKSLGPNSPLDTESKFSSNTRKSLLFEKWHLSIWVGRQEGCKLYEIHPRHQFNCQFCFGRKRMWFHSWVIWTLFIEKYINIYLKGPYLAQVMSLEVGGLNKVFVIFARPSVHRSHHTCQASGRLPMLQCYLKA